MARCNHPKCNRKISFVYEQIGRCKCGNVYCHKHRLDHACTFDYKAHNQQILRNELQKVVPQKVIKV